MKKICKLLLAGAALLTLSACSEEETEFSDYEKDWFVLEDSSDPAGHAAYEFYTKYKVPVFFNDTIGTQQRVDAFGHEYTYYKTLSLNYELGGQSSSASEPYLSKDTWVYCDKSAVPGAISFLDREIMPYIPKSMHIHSILLMENIYSMSEGNDVYLGMNTLVISKASALASNDEAAAKKLRTTVLCALIKKNITSNEEYAGALETFYGVSSSLDTESYKVYGLNTWYLNKDNFPSCPFDKYDYSVTNAQKALWAGFLGMPQGSYYNLPTKAQDVAMYAEAYLTYSDAEFEALYGTNELIMKKWRIIKPILSKLLS